MCVCVDPTDPTVCVCVCVLYTVGSLHFESARVDSVTRVLIERFSESLEGALSDGMLKCQLWNGP